MTTRLERNPLAAKRQRRRTHTTRDSDRVYYVDQAMRVGQAFSPRYLQYISGTVKTTS